jgi:hypothetical protein
LRDLLGHGEEAVRVVRALRSKTRPSRREMTDMDRG